MAHPRYPHSGGIPRIRGIPRIGANPWDSLGFPGIRGKPRIPGNTGYIAVYRYIAVYGYMGLRPIARIRGLGVWGKAPYPGAGLLPHIHIPPHIGLPYNARARNVRACLRARARGMNPRVIHMVPF